MIKSIPTPSSTAKQLVTHCENQKTEPIIEDYSVPLRPPRPKREAKKLLWKSVFQIMDKGLKGYTRSYKISINDEKDPLIQLQNTRQAIEFNIKRILEEMQGMKMVETLEVTFEKFHGNEIITKTAYFNSKPQIIINTEGLPAILEMTKEQILNMIAVWLSEGSGWRIQSVDNHYINIAIYKPINGKSYIKLPVELQQKRID